MIRYRVKTEQEFLEEFGSEWKYKTSWDNKGHMDYLFGYILPDDYTNENFNDEFDFYVVYNQFGRSWYIITKMVKQIITPSYNEKKVLVYD